MVPQIRVPIRVSQQAGDFNLSMLKELDRNVFFRTCSKACGWKGLFMLFRVPPFLRFGMAVGRGLEVAQK